jgi:hypothetical protein
MNDQNEFVDVSDLLRILGSGLVQRFLRCVAEWSRTSCLRLERFLRVARRTLRRDRRTDDPALQAREETGTRRARTLSGTTGR